MAGLTLFLSWPLVDRCIRPSVSVLQTSPILTVAKRRGASTLGALQGATRSRRLRFDGKARGGWTRRRSCPDSSGDAIGVDCLNVEGVDNGNGILQVSSVDSALTELNVEGSVRIAIPDCAGIQIRGISLVTLHSTSGMSLSLSGWRPTTYPGAVNLRRLCSVLIPSVRTTSAHRHCQTSLFCPSPPVTTHHSQHPTHVRPLLPPLPTTTTPPTHTHTPAYVCRWRRPVRSSLLGLRIACG